MSETLKQRPDIWARFLAPGLFFLISLAIVLNFHFIARDVDDIVRELQIRDLLTDRNWYDMRLPKIAMPEDYYSHYSRLVDAPYYFITRFLAPLVGQETAYASAKYFVPLGLLAVFSISFANIVRYLAKGKTPLVIIALAPFLIFFALINFSPNRVDHHNFQIVAMMVLFWGLLMPEKKGGYLIGCAALISVIVGLECLPFVAIAFAGLVAAGVWGDALSLEKLQRAGFAMLILAAPIGLILLGKSGISSVQCDAYSLPWIAGASLGGAALAGLRRLWGIDCFKGSNPVFRRSLSLVLMGIVLGGTMIALFPTCLDGPYHMIDPISREFWLEPMAQEKPIFVTLATAPFAFVMYCFVFVVAAFLIVRGLQSDLINGNYGVAIMAVIALTAFCMTLVQMRFLKFSTLFLTLFIAKIIADTELWRVPKKVEGTSKVHFWLYVIPVPAMFLVTLVLYYGAPKQEPEWNVYQSMVGNDCTGMDFSKLNEVPSGRIIAPIGLSLNLLDHDDGHKIAATAHHRSSPGIRNVIQAFTTNDTELRNSILLKFDYICVCAWDQGHIKSRETYDTSRAPLYLSLAADMEWPGLKLIPNKIPSSFRVYEIDHQALGKFNTAK